MIGDRISAACKMQECILHRAADLRKGGSIMKKPYSSPEINVTVFRSDSVTNVNTLSGTQTALNKSSAKEIKSANLLDF